MCTSGFRFDPTAIFYAIFTAIPSVRCQSVIREDINKNEKLEF